jgi:hypothetical protein
MGEKVAIFKKKEEVLLALGRGDVEVAPIVLNNSDFMSAEPNELLGFMAESGSDYRIISVRAIKNNPRAFFELAFGKEVNNEATS